MLRVCRLRGTLPCNLPSVPAAIGLKASGHVKIALPSITFKAGAIRIMQTSSSNSKASVLSNSKSAPLSSSAKQSANRSTSLPSMASTSCQKRGHAGHHHHHDTTYLTSTNKTDAGVRITRIGLWSNLGMAVGKGAGGYFFSSQALMADAIHSATDLASDFLTLGTVTSALKAPTKNYPLGFGKVESLGSLGVSGMLLVGGLAMCYGSVIPLYAHFMTDPAAASELLAHAHTHGHSHSHGPSIPSIHAAWLAAGTIVIKEWLYRATMKVAVERKSSVLNSNAVHHRVDSATGAAALLAIIAANVWPQVAYLDSVGGLAISAMVIAAGWNNTMAAFRELADRGIDNEIKASITKAAEKSIREHLDSVGEAFDDCVLRDVQGTKSGQNYLIDLEIAVPTHFTVTEMRRLEEAVRHTVGAKVRGVRRVKIRFIGMENDNTSLFDEFIPREVTQSIPLEQKDENGNGHSHDHDHAHEHSIGTIKKKL